MTNHRCLNMIKLKPCCQMQHRYEYLSTTKNLYYVIGFNLIFGGSSATMYNKDFPLTFKSPNNYDGFIGGRIKLRPFCLRTIFLSWPVKLF
jgi:hypothetical protein